MYALIQKNDGLPTMVNETSEHFPDYIQSGYEILHEGTKNEIEKIWDELIVEFANSLD